MYGRPNATTTSSSALCHGGEEEETANLCVLGGSAANFYTVRRTRISAAYKERLSFSTNKTTTRCEWACACKCSYWTALHSYATGYCYVVN
jgi:hypothetical protein